MLTVIDWITSFFEKPKLVVPPLKKPISLSNFEPVAKKPRFSANVGDDSKKEYLNVIDYLDDEDPTSPPDDFDPIEYFFGDDKPIRKNNSGIKRKRVEYEKDDQPNDNSNDEPELTGLTKKGTPYKSKAFVYGMAGERYVGKHIKCQRCGYALKQLTANTPAIDFECKNKHCVQLKSTKKLAKDGHSMNLMCGQYEMQKKALEGSMKADFMILNYAGSKVKKIKYLKNEDIKPSDLTPREKDQRVVKDKQVVGFKKFKASNLKVDCSLLENIDIPAGCNELELNAKFRKVVRRLIEENKNGIIPDYQIESFRNSTDLSRPVYYTVSLEKMTCSCPSFIHNCHKKDFQCKHIILACIRHFKQNIRSIRVADVRNGDLKRTAFFTINLHDKTCSCSGFALNKKCEHINRYC